MVANIKKIYFVPSTISEKYTFLEITNFLYTVTATLMNQQVTEEERELVEKIKTYVGSSGGGPATSPSSPFTSGFTSTCCTETKQRYDETRIFQLNTTRSTSSKTAPK